MRDRTFSICKGIGIILVVLGHAGLTGYATRFIYLFHMPLFFICAGYFFKLRHVDDEMPFVVRRLRGLYVPFVTWSLVLLCLHNLLFPLGILNETYGNAAGGVTHPYTWHTFQQRMWSIVFNMSGYDEFLGGTFWFFRALLVASLGYLVLFKLLRRVRWLRSPEAVGWAACGVALLLALWKVTAGLRVTGLAQGGYRDLMGLFFFGAGFLFARYRSRIPADWRVALGALAVLVLATFTFGTSLGTNATFTQFVSYPVPALAGFALCFYVSERIDAWGGWLARGLAYVGERTLCVFAFQFAAFKLVSALVVVWYGLDWFHVGGHPVVYAPGGVSAWFIVLYTVVGVAVPIGVREAYRRLKPQRTMTLRELKGWGRSVWTNIRRVIDASLPKED